MLWDFCEKFRDLWPWRFSRLNHCPAEEFDGVGESTGIAMAFVFAIRAVVEFDLFSTMKD